MKRTRIIFLVIIYVVMLLFTLVMEWIGISDPAMKAAVNLCTLAMAVLGGTLCFLVYRREQADPARQKQADGETEDTGEKPEAESVIDKETYLAFARACGLTRRETEIGLLVVHGYSNLKISEELYISETTVKKHLTHIYEKTGAGGRKELKKAAESGKGIYET